MSKLRIKTCDEFENALRAVPFAEARLAAFDGDIRATRVAAPTQLPYALWHAFLQIVDEATASQRWTAFRSLLQLYDAVERAGNGGEMREASNVAFLEDVCLPSEPDQLQEFWRHATPAFAEDLKRHLGIT